MANLRHQKRLAACVMKCGKRRVFLDPNEASEIALATTSNLNINLRKKHQEASQGWSRRQEGRYRSLKSKSKTLRCSQEKRQTHWYW